MKQSILGILSSVISAMKGNSRQYHSLIIPLIDSSVNVNSDTRIYLLEDAMDLWVAMLLQTPTTGVGDVVPLVPHLFPLLEVGSDTLRRALEITEAYIYLAPSQMLASINMFLPPLVNLLQTAKREATGLVLNIVELTIRSALKLGGNNALTRLLSNLLQCNFLQTVLTGLQDAQQAHDSTGPNSSKTWLDVLVETDYFCIISRIALASHDLFLEALRAARPTEQVDVTMKWLLPEWFRHMDNISHPEKKKLNCLALTALLQTGQPWIMEHLQDLMAIWTETALELYAEEGSKEDDWLIYNDPDALRSEYETAEHEGQRKVRLDGPSNTMSCTRTVLRDTASDSALTPHDSYSWWTRFIDWTSRTSFASTYNMRSMLLAATKLSRQSGLLT